KSNERCSASASSTTPRLLAKCAGRILRTRTNSSRISCASWDSSVSPSCCKSAGDSIRDRIVLMSRILRWLPAAHRPFVGPAPLLPTHRHASLTAPVADRCRQRGQSLAGDTEWLQAPPRLLAQLPRLPPALVRAPKSRV